MKRMTAALLVALSFGLWAPAASAHDRYYYYFDSHGVRHRVIASYREPRRVVVYRTYRPVIVREAPARFIPLPVSRRVPLPWPFRHF